jgi:DNA-binding MarR family transcriptional regulator
VTRLIDRLVADGLVERDSCLTDARGAEAVLTKAGLDRLRTASRTHLRGIDEHFLAPLEPVELEVIETTMLRVAERAGPGGEHDHCASTAAAMRESAGEDPADADD